MRGELTRRKQSAEKGAWKRERGKGSVENKNRTTCVRLSSWRGQDLNLQPSGYEPDELPIAPPRDIFPLQIPLQKGREDTMFLSSAQAPKTTFRKNCFTNPKNAQNAIKTKGARLLPPQLLTLHSQLLHQHHLFGFYKCCV